MAPQYKLQYFNVTGLGEPLRYMFSYGKIPFEDARFEFDEFDKIKPTTPFGKVPVVEVDGKQIHQSSAIGRYLAKKIGLAGKSEWDQLQADIVVDTIGDYRQYLSAWFREKDEAEKAAKFKEIETVHSPFYFSKWDKQVQENGGYLVNGQLTWADIYFAAFLDALMKRMGSLAEGYKNLQALKEKVDNLPGIKEYRAKRPETQF